MLKKAGTMCLMQIDNRIMVQAHRGARIGKPTARSLNISSAGGRGSEHSKTIATSVIAVTAHDAGSKAGSDHRANYRRLRE